ncbi:hypothetical protein [Shimia sp.]|uniref:hypothetical protein n=1 Tax=Shimia sp. TaxID=1954381 RepID=UPI003299569B
MKPTLFLHIGTHKTASTVIQDALDKNRDVLRAAGLLFPATTRGLFPELPKHDELFQTLVDPDPSAFEAEFAAFMKEYEVSGCKDMLLSEEALSEPRPEAYEKLRRFEKHFEIRVICYLRRPDFFLESLWNQRCKEGICKVPVGPFSRSPFNRERVFYDNILDWWSGFAKVEVINYETVKDGQILDSFAEVMGYSFADAGNPVRNASPSAQCALLMAAMNRQGIRFERRRMIAAFAGDQGKYALGGRLRADLLKDLAPHLERLEQGYGVRFDMEMPDEPKIPLTLLNPDICAKAVATLL